jgi:hypothetical protein
VFNSFKQQEQTRFEVLKKSAAKEKKYFEQRFSRVVAGRVFLISKSNNTNTHQQP